MSNVFVKPALAADGKPLLVRDPVSREPLAEAGEFKPRTPFWLRRIAQWDVATAKPPKPEHPAGKAPAKPPA